ncbi:MULTISPECIES: histidine kinase [Brevibacterium]|uniref:Energy-coupling factor transport system substrate-specific component n=2 Tax=Brevibacterium TaxID=1696 RepID=A0A1H1LCM4_BRESA|nr:histidine kinase [Brevibacterium sandarakinum]SDR72298.1 energy-coupling factor transport system substrate-specific component [Brevibacterium sandarakinum]
MNTTSRQSGQGPAHTVGPAQTQSRNSHKRHTLALTLTFLGTLVVLGTYVAVLLTQPANLGTDLGHTTLWVILGYLAGGILLAAGTLPLIPRSIIALIPVAIAANIVIGHVIGNVTPIPLYLDSIGTVMIGVLAGPAAGAFTGIISNLIWGVTLSPSVIAFSSGAAFIGAAAGWAARLGAFRTPWFAVLTGAIAGIPAGALGAPVAAYVFGGGLGAGTGGVVAILQAAGLEMLNATLAQSLFSDIIDKALIFALAYVVVRTLPRRILDRYPFTDHSLSRRSRAPVGVG